MDPNADRLPDLSLLQDKPLAAIFVTHAHADHIGALPLVHQIFPATPIYASRATMLIMEVMLQDALQIMEKRATTEQEIPLYDQTMVNSMLHYLRPIPMTGTLTISELPDTTIHTARAGHVAGAISIGFDSPYGRILVSGDVSVTPQHTIPGAQLSNLRNPDLFILESTYGARLHPNRQTEEDRLAQTVAEGIERGGHVLIPAFALGRAQEVLRILHMAQRRGKIPEFPVLVDGLVRKVCATYTAIPEALTPNLQRQIHKGYSVFLSGTIRSVTDAKQRERIVQGAPACIVSSSGMLTGGPSAYYAAQIAENPDASILITGYQDDEAPGRKLLALADQNGGTLDINDQTVTVRCNFNRYHLSAHADGNELTAMVSAVKPKKVALVHGDPESRLALAQRMERITEVLMPTDGQTIEIPITKRTNRTHTIPAASQPIAAPATQPLTHDSLEALWLAMRDGTGNQIVSIREIALAWYGTHAGQPEEAIVKSILDHACQNSPAGQLSFIPLPSLSGLYRIRAPEATEETSSETSKIIQPGALVLLQTYGEKIIPAICYDVRADAIWAYLPTGDSNRTRFPRTAVLEVIGSWKPYPITDIPATRQSLTETLKTAQRWQRQHQPRTLIEHFDPQQTYTFDEIANRIRLAHDDIIAHLALAITLNDTPRLFVRQQAIASPLHKTRYGLHEEWQTALNEGAGDIRPDQMWILSVVEQYIGTPSDLYRRSVNPDTGEVTLCFHFPAIARQHHKTALESASQEAGVTITIAPQPHQGALTQTAHRIIPSTLTVTKTSLHHEREAIRLRCTGTATPEELQTAIATFQQHTGWTLEIENETIPVTSHIPTSIPNETTTRRLDLHTAMAITRAALQHYPGFYKVSADQNNHILTVRFHFPDKDGPRCTSDIEDIANRTGWHITVYPEPHQGAIEALIRKLLPADLTIVGAPSLYRKTRQVIVKTRGTADPQTIESIQTAFTDTTGWTLILQEA